MSPERGPVPVRTIVTVIALAIGMSLATVLAIVLALKLAQIIGLLVVAAFFTIVLCPAVDFLVRQRMRRSMATVLVYFVGFGLLAAMLFAFVRPIAREVNQFIDDFPTFVQNAQEGRGSIGRLVQRYDIDDYIERNQNRLESALRNAGLPALEVARSVVSGLFAFLTVMVLTFLMILEAPNLTSGFLKLFRPEPRERIRKVAADCAKAVSGYMVGNLAISVVAGVATFAFLSVVGVPFAGVLGLWVAFADLIPLVGATLGAIPTIGVAFLASPTKGFVTLAFYVVYQQFENHVLQTTIMSRTVDINPLTVLVSVLIGVELFGILGALLAIPAAGVIQVIARNLYDERRGRLKQEPTVGADQVPVDEVDDHGGEAAANRPHDDTAGDHGDDADESPRPALTAGPPEPPASHVPPAPAPAAGERESA